MRVLVTGGAGCIGLETCRQLREQGHEVHLFDLPEQVLRVKHAIPQGARVFFGSILDTSSLREAAEGCDAVIHLAAYLGVARTERNRLRTLEINIDGTKNVLDVAVQHRLRKVVFASSSEVYGEPVENPVHEGVITQGKTVYAVSKLAGEELCRAYSQRYPELDHVVLRYFNTYGMHQVAKFVVPRFVWNVLNDKPPVINGDGRQRRSYCFAADTARATIMALAAPQANGEVVNVGSSREPVSLLELAERTIALAGKSDHLKPDVRADFARTDRKPEREIFTRFCDASKAKRLLGFEASVTLDDGLRRLIEARAIFPAWEAPDGEADPDEFV